VHIGGYIMATMSEGPVALLLVLLAACASSHPRDSAVNHNPRSEFPADATSGSFLPKATASSAAISASAPRSPRSIARAASRAIATDERRVYFGDDDDDAVLAVDKQGGAPSRIAKRAPVFGSIALDGDGLIWIATPGDVVLKVSLSSSAPPQTLRDRGIFTDLVTSRGDVFVTEVTPGGGALTRITGPTAATIGDLEGPPRGMAVDETSAYVALTQALVRLPRARGAIATIATGARLTDPHVDERYVYVTTTSTGDDALVARAPKTGGALAPVVRSVRPGTPTALYAGELYFIDARRPELRAVSLTGGAARIVATGDILESAVAMVVDRDGAFLATGDAGEILAASSSPGPKR
jgi:hypothetical protein